MACVVRRLLYGLLAAWLNKASRNKLDAFHAHCLRKILGIARVATNDVLGRLGASSLSSLLLEQQLHFFGKLARRPPSCPVRQLVFGPELAQGPPDFEHRRGRPRLEWTSEVFKIVA